MIPGYLYGAFHREQDPTIYSSMLTMEGTNSSLPLQCRSRFHGGLAIKSCRGVRPLGGDGIELCTMAQSSGPHPHDVPAIRTPERLIIAAKPSSWLTGYNHGSIARRAECRKLQRLRSLDWGPGDLTPQPIVARSVPDFGGGATMTFASDTVDLHEYDVGYFRG